MSSRWPSAATRSISAHCSAARRIRQQAIALADQQIADVERDRHAVLRVQRVASVSLVVASSMSSWISDALWKHSTATATFRSASGSGCVGILSCSAL